jgi:hypothetical protein
MWMASLWSTDLNSYMRTSYFRKLIFPRDFFIFWNCTFWKFVCIFNHNLDCVLSTRCLSFLVRLSQNSVSTILFGLKSLLLGKFWSHAKQICTLGPRTQYVVTRHYVKTVRHPSYVRLWKRVLPCLVLRFSSQKYLRHQFRDCCKHRNLLGITSNFILCSFKIDLNDCWPPFIGQTENATLTENCKIYLATESALTWVAAYKIKSCSIIPSSFE